MTREIMKFIDHVELTQVTFLNEHRQIIDPTNFPDMMKVTISLNGETLDLPLTSDISDALRTLLRVAKNEL